MYVCTYVGLPRLQARDARPRGGRPLYADAGAATEVHKAIATPPPVSANHEEQVAASTAEVKRVAIHSSSSAHHQYHQPTNHEDQHHQQCVKGAAPPWVILVFALAVSSLPLTPTDSLGALPPERRLQAPVSSWTNLKTSISGAATGTSIELTAAFNSNYDSEISISGKSITINGNGAVLDAGKNGRFFYLTSSASLTLYSVTLQNGKVPRF